MIYMHHFSPVTKKAPLLGTTQAALHQPNFPVNIPTFPSQPSWFLLPRTSGPIGGAMFCRSPDLTAKTKHHVGPDHGGNQL